LLLPLLPVVVTPVTAMASSVTAQPLVVVPIKLKPLANDAGAA